MALPYSCFPALSRDNLYLNHADTFWPSAEQKHPKCGKAFELIFLVGRLPPRRKHAIILGSANNAPADTLVAGANVPIGYAREMCGRVRLSSDGERDQARLLHSGPSAGKLPLAVLTKGSLRTIPGG